MAIFRATFQRQGKNPFIGVIFTANPGDNLSTRAWQESQKENKFMTEDNEALQDHESGWEIITFDYIN